MIYLIRVSGFGDVKIGVASDPLARLRQLQTGIPLRLRIIRVLAGERAEEKMLHQRFAHLRKSGEWFAFTEEMMGDLGLAQLPIPQAKRRPYGESPTGELERLIDELIEAVGGRDAVAKAIGIPPWFMWWRGCHKAHDSGLVVLARQAGLPITLRTIRNLRDAVKAESAAKAAERKAEKAKLASNPPEEEDDEYDLRRQADWIAKHGAEKVWWIPFQEPAPVVADDEEAA